MFKLNNLLKTLAITGLMFAASPLHAQVAQTEKERVTVMAERLATVMNGLEQRAESYPTFINDLKKGLVTIEQADERVASLIDQLRQATDQMDDKSELDQAIDDYSSATVDLIAEASASNNTVIKEAIPGLETSLAELRAADDKRAETVIAARNLIRSLEQNREAIAFFIKADQVQRASELIVANVADFSRIVEDGKALADGLIAPANP